MGKTKVRKKIKRVLYWKTTLYVYVDSVSLTVENSLDTCSGAQLPQKYTYKETNGAAAAIDNCTLSW